MSEMLALEIIEGVEGKCISLNNYRIAGPKPWGGGKVSWKREISVKDILKAVGLDVIKRAIDDLERESDDAD